MMIDPEHRKLFEEARQAEQAGDPYQAVKLYRLLVKQAPDWAPPYFQLAGIYKDRHEWKPCFHYSKRTVALEPGNQEAWWTLSIAASALKKERLARSIWTKFGWQPEQRARQPYGLQLQYNDAYEILWMRPQDPCRARILSIPHPGSGLRFREVVLYDRHTVGYQVVDQRRIPIYQCLGSHKKSPYQTFSCLIHTTDPDSILQLERLANKAGIGFEVWSNASRVFTPEHRQAFPEYYSNLHPDEQTDQCLVALAAVHEAEVQHLINNWQLLTYDEYSDLRGY